jgi:hypothetical protein
VDNQSKARLAQNWQNAPKMVSNWIMLLAGTLGAIWFSLPPEQQLVLLQNSPLPAWSYPVVLTAIGVIARLWPQKSLMPPETPTTDDVPTTTQPIERNPE